MVQDRGMGLPLEATEKNFTMDELAHLEGAAVGWIIPWRGKQWRVTSVDPLLLEEIQEK